MMASLKPCAECKVSSFRLCGWSQSRIPTLIPAKCRDFIAAAFTQRPILPFILPKWQEAEAAYGQNRAARQFSRQSVASAEALAACNPSAVRC
jgi:hypothetical protein